MLIGELAKVTGVSRDTIRLYEKRGMLTAVTRPNKWNNYKDYGDDNLKRIQIVKYLKRFSFTLKEIKEVLDRRDETTDGCVDRKTILGEKLEVIEAQIRELEQTRTELLAILK